MRILTPTGYVDAKDLQVGDLVIAYDASGDKILNSVLEKEEIFSGNQLYDTFDWYKINGLYDIFEYQSVWANGNVTHGGLLGVGDTLYDENDNDFVVTSFEKVTGPDSWYRFEISGDHSFIADNVTLHNASRFWVGGTGTWDSSSTSHWSSTTGGSSGASVPSNADTATFDASSGGGTVTPNYSMTVTQITMGAFTGTIDFSVNNPSPIMNVFSGTGTGVRTLKMGNGVFTLAGTGTIWSFATATSLTYDGTDGLGNYCTLKKTDSSATAFSFSGPPNTIVGNIQITAGTGTCTLNSSLFCNDLDFTGYSGQYTTTASVTCGGNITFGTGMTVPETTNLITMTGTGRATSVLTTNGVSVSRNLTINMTDATHVLQLADNYINSGTTAANITLTQGVLDQNGKTITVRLFSSTNTNTREIRNGSTWNLYGTNATICGGANLTSFTTTNSITFNFTGVGAGGETRTISWGSTAGSGSETTAPNFNITAGTDTISLATGSTTGALDVNFTGFSGTLAGLTRTIYGNLTLGAGMTVTTTTTVTSFKKSSGTQTITTNTASFPVNLTVNGGSTVRLADNLTADVSNQLNLLAGTLDLNGKTYSIGNFASSNSNVRSLIGNGGAITLNSTTVSSIWSVSGTSFTLDISGGLTINIASAGRTFASVSPYIYDVINFTLAGSTLTLSGVITANTFNATAGTQTIVISTGSTKTFTTLNCNGSAGNVTNFQNDGTATHSTVTVTTMAPQYMNISAVDFTKSGGGTVSGENLTVTNSTASPSSTWYAGNNSTNGGGNSGWLFGTPFVTTPRNNAYKDSNGVSTITGLYNGDGTTILNILGNPTNKSITVNNNTGGSSAGNAWANHDENDVPTLMAVSSVDGFTPVPLFVTSDGKLLINSN